MINMPSPGASVVNGTELQLLGGPRSALRRNPGEAHQGPSSSEQFARDSVDSVRSLPPPPRFGNALPQNELISAEEVKTQGLIPMFKAEPLLNGKCLGLYLRRGGCTYGNCGFCKKAAFSSSKVRRCLKKISLQMGRGPALLTPLGLAVQLQMVRKQ